MIGTKLLKIWNIETKLLLKFIDYFKFENINTKLLPTKILKLNRSIFN